MNAADKKAEEDFMNDMADAAEKEYASIVEDQRREFAQRNGNDSGFDPYWNLD